ncbi:MAG: arginine deiminase-related protein [Candidatus Saccharimonadales bacterium]
MPLTNRRVLMSDTTHFSNDQHINPYYHDEAINIAKASNELSAIRQLLSSAGVEVVSVASPAGSQDGVYTANWALVRGDTAILARLPDARKTEENWAEKVLTELGITVLRVPDGLKFSGQGDALACGNYLFCGQGYRSDEQAQKFAADTLGYERIQLQTVPELDDQGSPVINSASGWADSFFYDIDLALSIIRPVTDSQKGLIAYCRDAFTKDSQRIIANLDMVDKIEVSIEEADEAFACNLVSTGETIVMSENAPNLRAALESHGLTVVSPSITELVKGGGYIRCTSLCLD